MDDDYCVARVMAKFLAAKGLPDVVICTSASEALDTLVDFAPNLVLLDYSMEGQDELALLKRMSELSPGLPIVVITGNTAPGVEQSCLAAGASGWLGKPFGADFVEVVRGHLRNT